MTIFNSCYFTLGSSGPCFSSHHACLSSSKKLCLQHRPHLLHLQLFSHPPRFSFPHCPPSHLLSSQMCCTSNCSFPQLQISSPLPSPAAPQIWGHGHVQLTAKQRPAVCATSSLLTHATLLLSLLPQASPPSTEFCGIQALQSNKNSHGHQIGTERAHLVAKKNPEFLCKGKDGHRFLQTGKFVVSVPLYLTQAPA